MSYESESVLGDGATPAKVHEIVKLLGYIAVDDRLKVPNRTGVFFWQEKKDYKSFVGVELDVYRQEDKKVIVSTRTRVGRSYWDLTHQNHTIKVLRDVFGGNFRTDEGRNRYMRADRSPPPPIASGCFLARWRLHNALIKPHVYLSQRGLDQANAKGEATGHFIIDDMNPRLFSNNLVLPYIIAVWEEFFRFTFVALLTYSPQRVAALKRANLNQTQIEAIATDKCSIEQAYANSLSFQRPSQISKNFKIIDPKMDLAGALRKPYRKRNISLYESIEQSVEDRNEFVHAGNMNHLLSDQALTTLLKDIEVAVERCYQEFARHLGFVAERGWW